MPRLFARVMLPHACSVFQSLKGPFIDFSNGVRPIRCSALPLFGHKTLKIIKNYTALQQSFVPIFSNIEEIAQPVSAQTQQGIQNKAVNFKKNNLSEGPDLKQEIASQSIQRIRQNIKNGSLFCKKNYVININNKKYIEIKNLLLKPISKSVLQTPLQHTAFIF